MPQEHSGMTTVTMVGIGPPLPQPQGTHCGWTPFLLCVRSAVSDSVTPGSSVCYCYSWGSSRPRDQTCVSFVFCVGKCGLYHHATWEAHPFLWIILNLSVCFCVIPWRFKVQRGVATCLSLGHMACSGCPGAGRRLQLPQSQRNCIKWGIPPNRNF